MQYIYNQGGRYFWIHNTGPVGCLPYVMERIPVLASQIDKYGCASPFNEVAQFFNHGLKKAVEPLRKDLSHAAITYVDVYDVKFSLISQGRNHGESTQNFLTLVKLLNNQNCMKMQGSSNRFIIGLC